ncbi:hypothetical protein [Amycolatopsis regifaucium]|nr:hypothetical protein [Amycolatopsis regifaucium]
MWEFQNGRCEHSADRGRLGWVVAELVDDVGGDPAPLVMGKADLAEQTI